MPARGQTRGSTGSARALRNRIGVIVTYLLLLVGLVLIVKGGDLFVRAAVALAEAWRLPHVVIGATLMSLATTTPEIVVSITSGLAGASGLAVGNAVGSVLCNFGLIAGAIGWVRASTLDPRPMRGPFTVLALVSVFAFAAALGGLIDQWESLALLICGGGYFAYDFVRSLRSRSRKREHEAEVIESEAHPPRSMRVTIVLFLAGAAMVVGGSRLLVDNAVLIAASLGVPPLVIGLTVVAVGTSLPELVTAVIAARQGVVDLSIGNLIGANIANWTLVAGAAGALTPIHLTGRGIAINFTALAVMLLVFGYFVFARRRFDRVSAAGLLGVYAVYLVVLLSVFSQPA